MPIEFFVTCYKIFIPIEFFVTCYKFSHPYPFFVTNFSFSQPKRSTSEASVPDTPLKRQCSVYDASTSSFAQPGPLTRGRSSSQVPPACLPSVSTALDMVLAFDFPPPPCRMPIRSLAFDFAALRARADAGSCRRTGVSFVRRRRQDGTYADLQHGRRRTRTGTRTGAG